MAPEGVEPQRPGAGRARERRLPPVVNPHPSPQEPNLSPEEVQRYGRHLVIPEVGIEGQRRLRRARVLVVGVGGLGSPTGLYLAAAGVGTLGLVDFDAVDVSNLQRQVLFSADSVGKPKLAEAGARLKGLNPWVRIEPHETRLSSQNALGLFRRYDVVVDGTDNFPTRYLVNDACVLTGRPNVYGSIFRFDGQVSVFWGGHGPCYRCLYPEPPPPGLVPSCAEGGVLGVLPGVIGSLQAVEALKLILGIGEPLVGRLALFDALKMEWRMLTLRRDPACPVCGDAPTVRELADYEAFCGVAPTRPGGAAVARGEVPEITVETLQAKLALKEDVFVLDVREPWEHELARLPGSTLIPLGQLEGRLGELERHRGRQIAVHCKLGGRSAKAVKLLRSRGFDTAVNVAGGISAWSERVDPSVAKY